MTKSRQVADFGAGGFYAGKNKIINGDFAINQRAFSSTSTNSTFMFDRWLAGINGTATFSAQTFTPGAAPVAGYEGTNFIRVAGTSQSSAGNYISLSQRIEDVRTLAGRTVTVSFWAKASSGTPSVAIDLYQDWINSSSHSNSSNIPITTSWARYSATLTLPSLSGATIGANSYTQLWLFTSVGSTISGFGYPALGLQTATIDFWGIQVEIGSVATPFSTATGTLAGELAACQRYYYRITPNGVNSTLSALGAAGSTTGAVIVTPTPVTLRTNPSSIDYSTLSLIDAAGNNTAITALALSGNTTSGNMVNMDVTVASGLTAQRPYWIRANASTSAYLGFSSEL